MKKYILFLVLAFVLLQGCMPGNSPETDPPHTTSQPMQTPTVTTAPPVTTAPTETTSPSPTTEPTQPPTTVPTDPTVSIGTVDPELFADLTGKFADWSSWYNMALTSEYSTPADIDLGMFFYRGFEDESREPTEQEYTLLKEIMTHKDHLDWMALFRLPVSKMDAVLYECFGITTAEMDKESFEKFLFLEETNCYYFLTTGAHRADISAFTGAEMLDDGSIRIFYTQFKTAYAVTLKPEGGRYIIWSNLPV